MDLNRLHDCTKENVDFMFDFLNVWTKVLGERSVVSSVSVLADPVSHIPCVPARASSGDDARPPPIVPCPGQSSAGQVTRWAHTRLHSAPLLVTNTGISCIHTILVGLSDYLYFNLNFQGFIDSRYILNLQQAGNCFLLKFSMIRNIDFLMMHI